jgi:hypothetical protein
MIALNWIKKVAEEVDANRERFFTLFEKALPGGMRKVFNVNPPNYKRRYGVVPQAHPDKNSVHTGAIHGDKINVTRRACKTGKPKSDGLTNHQRVYLGRVRRNPQYSAFAKL